MLKAVAHQNTGGGSLTLTDGVNTVNGVTQITVSGGTVGGASPDATLTVTGAGGGVTIVDADSFPFTITAVAGITLVNVYASGAAVTIELPAIPAVGSMVRIVDMGNTASIADPITIDGNGNNIVSYGSATNSSIEIAAEGGDKWLGWSVSGSQWG